MRHRRSQQGIALVITLVMLSVVTLMAVTFLAISRRERAAVTVYGDQVDARDMTEMALARAQAEVAARIQAATNLLNYDLLVSTNFIGGFNPADGTNIFNVGFTYRGTTNLLDNEADLLRAIGNLQIDPRAPVFLLLPGAQPGQRRLDFRFYHDFNRNGQFESNGFFVGVFPQGGLPLPTTNHWVGDPEWIGVLRRPDLPHSGTNPFVGRFAYLVLPTGKSLDVNFMHNMAKRSPGGGDVEGYLRNQGVGSWELNFAAFLRGLNSNTWGAVQYTFDPDVQRGSRGLAFQHAFDVLQYRYNRSFLSLARLRDLFNPLPAGLARDGVDLFTAGPVVTGLGKATVANNPGWRWSGDDSPAGFHDIQELFNVTDNPSGAAQSFAQLLRRSGEGVRRGTYNYHTFYRLLAQLGTDSTLGNRGRLHLNYDNRLDLLPPELGLIPDDSVGRHATNFFPWQPLAFYTNAADLMVRASFHGLDSRSPLYGSTNIPSAITNLTATRIPVWPDNYYTPAVHRLFQLAANLYDATTTDNPGLMPGSTATNLLQLPTVFRPLFGNLTYTNHLGTATNGLGITGWAVVTNDWRENVWSAPHADLAQRGNAAVEARVAQGLGRGNLRVAGVPLVIGARRGHPNFNEFAMQTVATIGRKLEVVKNSPNGLPVRTNQMYTLGISNVFGIEFWNSYQAAYPRALNLMATLESDFALSNQTRLINLPRATNQILLTRISTNHAANSGLVLNPGDWQGRQFIVPIATNQVVVDDSYYSVLQQRFLPIPTSQTTFESVRNFEAPVWDLWITNRLRAVVVDTLADRIVDYVDLDDLNTRLNISRALLGRTNDAGNVSVRNEFWATNRPPSARGLPRGVQKQINVSMGTEQVSTEIWPLLPGQAPLQPGQTRPEVSRFRSFVSPDVWPAPANTSPTLRMQVPFSPARRLFVNRTWQVNDPLVHYLTADIIDPLRDQSGGPEGIDGVEPILEVGPVPTDQNNLLQVNNRYLPWATSGTTAPQDFDWALKDPQITGSDAWDFPTNAFPNLGWIGRVHRGTPWQTVYLKSGLKADGTQLLGAGDWFQWSGHRPAVFPNTTFVPPSTHPTNDWRVLELFTTAPNDNAARGLLGVNQDQLGAWSAVLGGLSVVTNSPGQTTIQPAFILPGSANLNAIVDGINRTRTNRPAARFNYLGEVLATPELSDDSPYLRLTSGVRGSPPDAAVERIPQQILGLLNRDDPRVVIYGFGQSLKPAPDSAVVEPGRYFLMSTNYQITGEYATRAVVRFEGDPRAPRAVVENFQVMPPPE
ncbi:MAG: hypothetical protein ACKVYV_11325 [Limisphaerales bacterium]